MDSNPYIISIDSQAEAGRLQEGLGVAPEGIEIMAPMAVSRLARVGGLSARNGNILKQEILALGGDAALPEDVYDLADGEADVIVMGTPSQLVELVARLGRHGPELSRLAGELDTGLANYERGRNGDINLPPVLGEGEWLIMGILNVTPDSFHDGGRYLEPDEALTRARAMVAEGAAIIDVGGESTRPGSGAVGEKEELRRVLPVVEAVAGLGVPVSIDTAKAEVAREALRLGAAMINDVTALGGDAGMAPLAAEHGCPVCLMHMQGSPADMQQDPRYRDVVGDITAFFRERIEAAAAQGIAPENIILDPGIGFGKTLAHNLEIINRLDGFLSLGHPLMVGASRKSFIGAVLDRDATDERLAGTIAASVLAYARGARIFRVHDVRENHDALAVAAAAGEL